MTANLRLRLLVLLLVPLVLLALMGGWFSYSSADAASTVKHIGSRYYELVR